MAASADSRGATFDLAPPHSYSDVLMCLILAHRSGYFVPAWK